MLQIVFEFESSNLDLMESFWRFKIPTCNISVPFLLVGQATDPQIAFDRSHLNFGSLLIGAFILSCGSNTILFTTICHKTKAKEKMFTCTIIL